MLLAVSTPIIIDIVFCLIILVTGLIGIKKGFVGMVLSLCGWIGSFVLAWLLKDQVTKLLESWFGFVSTLGITITNIISFSIIVFLVKLAVFLMNKLFKFATKHSGIGKVNRILGFIFGLLKGAVYVCILLIALTVLQNIKTVNEKVTPVIEQTYITKNCQKVVEDLIISKINKDEIVSSVKNKIEEKSNNNTSTETETETNN